MEKNKGSRTRIKNKDQEQTKKKTINEKKNNKRKNLPERNKNKKYISIINQSQ